MDVDSKPGVPPTFSLQVQIVASASEKPGVSLRLVTPKGITNQLAVRVSDAPVILEQTADNAIRAVPAVFNGRLATRGENDAYSIDVAGGETLTFAAVSATPAFDPSISIYERSGSWFDPKRLNRIAFNDEPLHFPGLSSNPMLVHTFAKSGRYTVQVGAFSGQGGPDYIYELQITRGAAPKPSLHPKPKPEWDERRFTRTVSADWLQTVAARSGAKAPAASPELFSAAANVPSDAAASIPVMSVPGIVQGRLTKAAEVHSIRLRIDKPQDLAFEIETPEATMPRFNPDRQGTGTGGAEIVTNVHTKLNNNGLYMMKMIQAKMTVSFRNPGEYRHADPRYHHGLLRPRLRLPGPGAPSNPSCGQDQRGRRCSQHRARRNKAINLTVEREEDFAAPVSFSIEGLPRVSPCHRHLES